MITQNYLTLTINIACRTTSLLLPFSSIVTGRLSRPLHFQALPFRPAVDLVLYSSHLQEAGRLSLTVREFSSMLWEPRLVAGTARPQRLISSYGV
jgi:hypothetical protein